MKRFFFFNLINIHIPYL